MKRIMKLLGSLVLLALLLVPAAPVLAMGFDGGPVIFGGNYTLKSGDTLNSDLVVFGGNVEIQEQATVKGSIVVFGGNVIINVTTDKDVVLIGGAGSLGPKAVVKGDLVTVGGSFNRDPGSRVEGEIRSQPSIEITPPTAPQVPTAPTPPKVDVNMNPIGSAVSTLAMAIVLGAVAMLLVLFMHPQMDRVAQTAIRQPVLTGGAGLLAIFAIIVAAITIILIPVALLAIFILLPLAWVLGITSLGMEVGERFTRAIEQSWPPALSAGFGTFLMMLVVGGIGMVPCVGWIVPALVGLVGIGAVALTLFGSRPYPAVTAGPTTGAPAAGPSEPLPPAS